MNITSNDDSIEEYDSGYENKQVESNIIINEMDLRISHFDIFCWLLFCWWIFIWKKLIIFLRFSMISNSACRMFIRSLLLFYNR